MAACFAYNFIAVGPAATTSPDVDSRSRSRFWGVVATAGVLSARAPALNSSLGDFARTLMCAAAPNVLVLDHLNLNHERGRHDLVNAFYFETLGCVPDPRKAENLKLGRKGVWANAGMHQFHLSEGATAQVFDGEVLSRTQT